MSVIATWFLMEAPSWNQVTIQLKMHGIKRETEVVIRSIQTHDDLSVLPGAPCNTQINSLVNNLPDFVVQRSANI